jgi:hypothetical protein
VPPEWRLNVSSCENAQPTVRRENSPACELHDRSPRGSQPQRRLRGRWPSLPKTSTLDREPHLQLSFSFEFPAFSTNRTSSLGNFRRIISAGRFCWSILTRLRLNDGSAPARLRTQAVTVLVPREYEVVKATKKRSRKPYTAADTKLLRQHSKARTPVAKIVKLMKRSEGSLRQKARTLGIGLGHQR